MSIVIKKTRVKHIYDDRYPDDYEVVSTAAFLRKVQARQGPSISPLLPAGTVVYGKSGDLEAVIIQEEPGPRTISWREPRFSQKFVAETRSHRVSFPYVVIGFNFNRGKIFHGGSISLGIFYRNTAVSSLEDPLYETNLLNINGTHNCLNLESESYRSIASAALAIREAFWSRTFNGGLTDTGYSRNAKATTGNIDKWAARTKKDPLFALKVEWPRHEYYTVQRLLNGLLGNEDAGSGRLSFEDLQDCCDKVGREEDEWSL